MAVAGVRESFGNSPGRGSILVLTASQRMVLGRQWPMTPASRTALPPGGGLGNTLGMAAVAEKARRRWFRSAPDRCVLGLLALEGFLLLSQWFRWIPFDRHKGWTVLICMRRVAWRPDACTTSEHAGILDR
jgi:hypothetical protein